MYTPPAQTAFSTRISCKFTLVQMHVRPAPEKGIVTLAQAFRIRTLQNFLCVGFYHGHTM
jgi:hypothetical protein